MDVWVMVSDRIKPQDGWQAATGLYWTLEPLDISLEGYYKRSYNSLDYRSGATLLMNADLADDLLTTTGRSYGAEIMVRKSTGRLNGWVSYTYSRSLMKETQDDDPFPINGGKWYNAPHDKPHALKLVANYKFTHRYSLSLNTDYSTGRPITVPTGTFIYGGKKRMLYTDRNAVRIPDYFRMDLALNIEPGHYLRQLTHMSYTIGVYNVTGRKNVYSVYYTVDDSGEPKGHMVSVFATQVPYININLKF
jgi:outer membrane receptor protein involved in Fe transport